MPGWQALHAELRDASTPVTIVTIGIETDGADALREFVDAASPEHPSLVDDDHVMERAFGVVNIPNVVWIDEAGTIVRPPEPGWAGPQDYPQWLVDAMNSGPDAAKRAEAARAGQDRDSYADAVRDWAKHGADSQYVMSPDAVIAASQPRGADESAAAAHFEIGARLWRDGDRDGAFEHWRETHRLDATAWTYKRQAWSLVGNEASGGGDFGRFMQFPTDDSWPFEGDFATDTGKTKPGEYYPKTL